MINNLSGRLAFRQWEDADGSTTVFRILQEILTNVVRHAEATQVEVKLEETPTFLTLQVYDNGRGITESEIDSPKSIGLLGMQERARLTLRPKAERT